MPTDQDLFAEEQAMVTMSFGEHIEELRVRLILALLGLFVGVVVVFLPPLDIAVNVMLSMQQPAKKALKDFYDREYARKVAQAQADNAMAPRLQATVPAEDFFTELKKYAPQLPLPPAETLRGQTLNLPVQFFSSGLVKAVQESVVQTDQSVISLHPLETITILFSVGVVSGLVLVSPWVFYQAWAFIAAGLYRHEKRYVHKYLPFSVGLFLSGVLLCFFGVLPVMLNFLLQFNVYLGVAPTLRLSEWMGFATLLPLIFGVAFQTPLVMLLLERIHIFTIDDFRAKRRIAILIIAIVAAVITPTPDPFSMLFLAGPMILLYELGILLISQGKGTSLPRLTG